MMIQNLAKLLKSKRKQLKITRYRLAKDSGVDVASIYIMESGKQPTMTAKTAKKLAKALGNVTAGQLLGIE